MQRRSWKLRRGGGCRNVWVTGKKKGWYVELDKGGLGCGVGHSSGRYPEECLEGVSKVWEALDWLYITMPSLLNEVDVGLWTDEQMIHLQAIAHQDPKSVVTFFNCGLLHPSTTSGGCSPILFKRGLNLVRHHSSSMCQKLCCIDRTVKHFTLMGTDPPWTSESAWLKATEFFAGIFCFLHDLIHQINAINPQHLFLEHLLYTMCTLVIRHCDCVSSLVWLEYSLLSDGGKVKKRMTKVLLIVCCIFASDFQNYKGLK